MDFWKPQQSPILHLPKEDGSVSLREALEQMRASVLWMGLRPSRFPRGLPGPQQPLSGIFFSPKTVLVSGQHQGPDCIFQIGVLKGLGTAVNGLGAVDCGQWRPWQCPETSQEAMSGQGSSGGEGIYDGGRRTGSPGFGVSRVWEQKARCPVRAELLGDMGEKGSGLPGHRLCLRKQPDGGKTQTVLMDSLFRL